VTIPPGSILNPEPSAAVGVRFATGVRVMDLVFGCLSQATERPDTPARVRGRAPTAGSGLLGVVLLSLVDERTGELKVNVVQPMWGGSGGRPTKDGIDGADLAAGFPQHSGRDERGRDADAESINTCSLTARRRPALARRPGPDLRPVFTRRRCHRAGHGALVSPRGRLGRSTARSARQSPILIPAKRIGKIDAASRARHGRDSSRFPAAAGDLFDRNPNVLRDVHAIRRRGRPDANTVSHHLRQLERVFHREAARRAPPSGRPNSIGTGP
jgi:hypothetical protein